MDLISVLKPMISQYCI